MNLHLGDFETFVLVVGIAIGFCFWGISKAIDAYFRGKIAYLEKHVRKGGAK